jgi:hypothetical protein
MQRRPSNAKSDCEEKRDPDKRSQPTWKKENELDPDTQLEKRTFAAVSTKGCSAHKADVLLRGLQAHLFGQDADARSDDGTFYATSVDQNFPCCATDSGAYNSALKGCAPDACGEAECRGSH